MIKAFFITLFFQPLYNILVFLTVVLPGHDVGLAIVLLTIIVRLALFPLYHKSTKTQAKLKEIEPALKSLKEKHGDDREAQAKATMELYKEHGINPFSGFLLLLIQLPIIISLYQVFKGSLSLHSDLVYSFITLPQTTGHLFLGLIDITSKSLLIAIIVGLTQFIQMQLALPPLPKKTGEKQSFSDEMSRNMQLQMKYFLPVMIIFIARSLPIAISLYWITSNLFSIGHELIVKKKALEILAKVKRPQG